MPMSDRPIKVLMIATGEQHDYETLPPKLAQLLTGRGDMTVEVTGDLSALNKQNIGRYDVLVFNTCTQAELDESARRAIVKHVRSGKGLVPMHCAFWSFQYWPEWREMVGRLVLEHDKFGPYSVTVLDPDHATMLGLGGKDHGLGVGCGFGIGVGNGVFG